MNAAPLTIDEIKALPEDVQVWMRCAESAIFAGPLAFTYRGSFEGLPGLYLYGFSMGHFLLLLHKCAGGTLADDQGRVVEVFGEEPQ